MPYCMWLDIKRVQAGNVVWMSLMVLYILQEPVVPMSFLRAKPIGVMQMIDQGEQDDKIIAVHADDPEFKGYTDISELPKHRLMEIRRSVLPRIFMRISGRVAQQNNKP